MEAASSGEVSNPAAGRRLSWLQRAMEAASSGAASEDTEETDTKTGSTGKPRSLTAGFIKSDFSATSTPQEGISMYRHNVDRVMSSIPFDLCVGIVVIIDISMNIMSIDARSTNSTAPAWIDVAGYFTLAIYTLEFAGNVFTKQWKIVHQSWIMLDLVILIAAYGELALQGAGINIDSVGFLRILRIVRIMRLLKLFRKFIFLKELRKLVLMAASCIKTLGWSFMFCFVVMTVWAMATVEFVHPVVKELFQEKELDDWESTATVMRANLLLFKTVIAGDSWGTLAVPVINRSPMTFIIFVGSQLTLVFGVLNLVVAVVVDTFAEQRQKDVENLAQEMQVDEEYDLKLLAKMFKKIDEDQSGELSLDELMEGARKVPEFQSRLRVMDIDEQDLEQLFYMIDSDGGGSIDPSEFISALSRWIRTSTSATRFVKYNVERGLEGQNQIFEHIRALKHSVDKLSQDNKRLRKERLDQETKRRKALQHDVSQHVSEGSSVNMSSETSLGPNLDDVQALPNELRHMLNSAAKDVKAGISLAEDLKHKLHTAAEDMKAGALLHEQDALEDVERILQGALSNMQQVLLDAGARSVPKPETGSAANMLRPCVNSSEMNVDLTQDKSACPLNKKDDFQRGRTLESQAETRSSPVSLATEQSEGSGSDFGSECLEGNPHFTV